jgi:hypothetical protein
MAAIYSNGGNRWNILGFNFTKRDALSSVYKISMVHGHGDWGHYIFAQLSNRPRWINTCILVYFLLAWQNYWMLIGWEEYNYFINCTAVQLMIFPKQTKWRKGVFKNTFVFELALEELDENTNKSTKFCFNKITNWTYEQKHQILVESLAGLATGERIWCWYLLLLTLRSIQFCHANNKQVIMRCCSYN